jgi:phosphosulfolactate synthase
MVIDRGLGIRATKDLVEMASDYIDVIQLSGATSIFYDMEVAQAKIKVLREAEIEVMPGGSFLEVAIWQRAYDSFLQKAKELGISTLSVYDRPVELNLEKRKRIIEAALDKELKMISEIWKKDVHDKDPISMMKEEIEQDLESGVFKVIVALSGAEIDQLMTTGVDPDSLLWECPSNVQEKDHIIHLIERFGQNVNLVIKDPNDILFVETLRSALRNPILSKIYEKNPKWR